MSSSTPMAMPKSISPKKFLSLGDEDRQNLHFDDAASVSCDSAAMTSILCLTSRLEQRVIFSVRSCGCCFFSVLCRFVFRCCPHSPRQLLLLHGPPIGK